MSVIAAKGLTKRHGKTVAVDRIDWTVEPGQIVGLLGPNGAGKSSLLNAVLGLTPYEGSLRVLGLDPWAQRDAIMQDVCFVSDVSVLPRNLRADQLMAYIDGVHPRFNLKRAQELVARSGIAPKAPIKSLSRGMLAQLHLCIVMAIDAKLLVLDEPTLGLDAMARQRFFEQLLGDYADGQRAIVIASHELHELAHVFSHLVFLNQGRVVAHGAAAEVFDRYAQVEVPLAQAHALRALGPVHERTALGQAKLVFDLSRGAPRSQIESIARVKTPSLEELFVVLLGDQANTGVREAV
jgi:ABC-2 type transport system ATP-binding protein